MHIWPSAQIRVTLGIYICIKYVALGIWSCTSCLHLDGKCRFAVYLSSSCSFRVRGGNVIHKPHIIRSTLVSMCGRWQFCMYMYSIPTFRILLLRWCQEVFARLHIEVAGSRVSTIHRPKAFWHYSQEGADKQLQVIWGLCSRECLSGVLIIIRSKL